MNDPDDALTWSSGREAVEPSIRLTLDSPERGRIHLIPYTSVHYWAVPSRELSEKEVELWHLGQFASDFYTGTGRQLAPWGAVAGAATDRSVLVHWWATGRIDRLLPERETTVEDIPDHLRRLVVPVILSPGRYACVHLSAPILIVSQV